MEPVQPATDSNLERRREQNRLAQRRFRGMSPAVDVMGQSKAAVFEQNCPIQEGRLCEIWGPDYQFLHLPITPGEGTESDACTDAATRFALDAIDQGSEAVHFTSVHLAAHPLTPLSMAASRKDDPERETIRGVGDTDTAPPTAAAAAAAVTEEAPENEMGAQSHGQSWRSPLHMAVQRGNDKIVKLLLQHCQDCNDKDGDGMTPLMYAVMGGHEDVVRTLLANAARVSVQDGQGRSPIHWAVAHQHGAILGLLLENCHGLAAAVNAYDGQGQAPLHMAIDLGFEDGVQMLLMYGADLGLRARKL